MHRLCLTDPRSTTTWTFADGLFRLPEPVATALNAEALIVAGEHALLLEARRTVPLQAHRALPCGPDAELQWTPDPRPRPQPMPADPTAAATRTDAPARLHLLVDDGREVTLDDAPVLIGRHPAADLHLHDAAVSALHCLLVPGAAGVRVLDLGSTNGTLLRGMPATDARVRHRGLLRIGPRRLALAPETDDGDVLALPSPQMQVLDGLLERVAPTDAPVLIVGDSGVGKDAVARRLHALSGRPGRFVVLNAAALTPTLSSSELFGHVRGAFTGADRDHDGLFLAADAGTLFLDEVAELPAATQAELLRVVESGRVRRVGDGLEIPVDVRLIAATHADLPAAVRAGRFRADLFHRLSVVPLHVPPLCQRPEDLEALVRLFLAQEEVPRSLSKSAWLRLRRHNWPGNIRELRHCLRRACLMSDAAVLEPHHFNLGPAKGRSHGPHEAHNRVLEVYAETGENAGETALRLGIHRATVYRHLRDARNGRRRGSGNRW